jgi:hypothetical protein
MPLLTQFYGSKQGALGAAEDLKKRGLRDRALLIIDTLDERGDARLVHLGVRRQNAADYASRIKSGQTLLLVDAPFAGVAVVQNILDRPKPQPMAVPVTEGEGVEKPKEEGPLAPSRYEGSLSTGGDNAALLSSALGLPVLSDDPTPLSSALGIPALTRDKPAKRVTILSNFFPSRIFGPLIIKKGAPVTPDTLTKNQGPITPATLIKSGKPITPFTLLKSGKPITPFTLTKNQGPIGFGLPLLIEKDRDNSL